MAFAVSSHGQFRGWFNHCRRACRRTRSTRQAAGQTLKRIPVQHPQHTTINIRPLGQGNAFLGYFLSLGQEVTRRLRRRNSGACQERHPAIRRRTIFLFLAESRGQTSSPQISEEPFFFAYRLYAHRAGIRPCEPLPHPPISIEPCRPPANA
jgi:hypothetical protein